MRTHAHKPRMPSLGCAAEPTWPTGPVEAGHCLAHLAHLALLTRSRRCSRRWLCQQSSHCRNFGRHIVRGGRRHACSKQCTCCARNTDFRQAVHTHAAQSVHFSLPEPRAYVPLQHGRGERHRAHQVACSDRQSRWHVAICSPTRAHSTQHTAPSLLVRMACSNSLLTGNTGIRGCLLLLGVGIAPEMIC